MNAIENQFQSQCLSVFPTGNIDFPSECECVADYATASVESDVITVILDDFGGCSGTGSTVREAFERADLARHRVAREFCVCGTDE